MDPAKLTSGAVVARDDFTDDLWMVRIRPQVPISFRAGQYVTVGVEQNGKLLERPYSIVSAPQEPELELFVELVPPGLLTPHLHPLGGNPSHRELQQIIINTCFERRHDSGSSQSKN